MQIGRMRERVKIQQEQRVDDGGGGYTGTWQNVTTVWAEVTPLQGKEQLDQQKLQATTLYRVTIRYQSTLHAGNRLLWRNTPLNIRAITNPDQKREFHEIICEEGVAQ